MVHLATPLTPRRRSRDDARAEKRRRILDAAKRVFQRLGYEGASMNDIVAEARVSKPTLYVYFQNKEGLFAALVEDLKSSQPEGALGLDPKATDVARALKDFGYKLIQLLTNPDHIAVLRMVIGAADKFPELGRILYNAGPCRGLTTVSRFLEAQVAAGRLDIDDIELAAWQFLELVKAGHMLPVVLNVGEPRSPQAMRRSIDRGVDVFVRGYAPTR